MLNLAYTIVNNTNTTYNYLEISNITGTDKQEVNKIFGVYDYNNSPTTMTPLELSNLILNNKDNDLLKGKLNNSSINELSLVREVMNGTLNQIMYSSSDLSSLLNIDSDTMSLLFSLYNSKYIKSNEKISLKNYVDFIVKDVMNNKDYSENFDTKKREKLTTINKIMNNSLNGNKIYICRSFCFIKHFE